ncbi:SusC/RagA family TonB-linked outer membrane protein [Spirosoma utsteinense]|uniref:TonB-linked SusC/RagA family outer membrane protein n=1 Tax=Spirosoma utsteinense TaxID=2585773 RepID=A0ABR6VZT2_9BACT|nr:TonB-dependent receptor [Spirosoma utsteinense]MBC3786851.1 TonB-linked SusC/RagA family outer membrane protein [Spirosoma utsteinense]MBC3789854.1 TonB-linked SusC/RagA family outer membrane protein [Spirosoma utsteinense]
MLKHMLSGFFIVSNLSVASATDKSPDRVPTNRNEVVSALYLDRLAAENRLSDVKALIRGIVSDERGGALPGATVSVKGTQVGTTTDADGKFTLNVPAGAQTLVVSYIGMTTQEVAIGSRQSFDIKLKAADNVLNDVVVIGYGTQRRQDVNGAISSVRSEDIANIPQPSVDQLLQGRAAGLTVTQNSGQPGSSTSVRIRGVTSLTGSSEPLYVIDGVPISGDANNQSTSGRSPLQNFNGSGQSGVSPLSLINPNDIESIDVLKDASATAIYGNRAANGVIIITTKRGKNGSARIAYDGYVGIQSPSKYLSLMKLQQYAKLQNDLADVYGTQRRAEFSDPSLLPEGTDWQREVFKSAVMQNHQVSISGGKEGINYYVSGGYLKQDGIVIGSGFNRYTFRTNVDGQVKPWFKMGVSLTGSSSVDNVTLNDNVNGIIYLAMLQSPDVAVRNPDGSFAGPPNDPNATAGVINPVAQALSITNRLNRTGLNGNLYADIKFSNSLSFRTELGGDFGYSDNTYFVPTYSFGRFVNTTATLNQRWQKNTFNILKNYFTYTHTFGGDHNITGLLGHEVQQSRWNGIEGYRAGFYSNDIKSLNLGEAATATNNEFKGSQSLESVYARAIYAFKDRYSLTATIRGDRSSKFAQGRQVGYFPSFAASWRIIEEPFMAGVKKVADDVRIRVGYGSVGNQQIANYLYGSSLSPTSTGLGTGFLTDRIANPDLKWESNTQVNVGVDLAFLGSRFNATIDVYNKLSKNFLYQLPLPAYLIGDFNYLGGIASPYVNLGQMQNRGIDLTLTSKNITKGDFRWNTTLIFSQYKNSVKELSENFTEIINSVYSGFLNVPVTRTVVGQPIGQFYGYKVKGLFQNAEQLSTAPVQFNRPVQNSSAGTWLGDVQYEDVNGDGVVNEQDRTIIGNPNPKFTFGLTNTFSYKSFDVSLFLQGSYGAKILNLTRRTVGGLSNLYNNQFTSAGNYWTPANTNTDVPAPKSGIDNPNLFISDRFVEDGSYARIQNLNIGYNVPTAVVRRVKLNRLKVYASVQNLYTFTSYSGYDPEVGAFNQNSLQMNVENGRYPLPRTYTFGINAEF